MKKKTRLRFAALFAFCAIAAGACFAAGCGGVKLVDFADGTEEVQYGSVYELALDPVRDAAGNSYEVSAEVTNSEGGRVAVFDGMFDVTDLGGYTVVYTARSGSEVVGERTVTLTIDTKIAPTLKFSEYSDENTFEIGDVFRLPTYIAYSPLTEQVEVEEKLFYTEGGESERTAENGTFVPEDAGGYVYRLTATDGQGNETQISYEFSIRSAPQAAELESFDSAASLNNIRTDPGELGVDAMSYCAEEIEGVAGSVKMEVSEKWPQIYLKPRQELSLAEYKWISFKLYIDPQGLAEGRRKTAATPFPGEGVSHNTLVTPGEWTLIYADAAKFSESAAGNGYGLLFSFNNDNWASGGDFRLQDTFTCYLADVRMEKANEPETEEDFIDLSSTTVLQNIHSGYQNEWDFGFDYALTDEAIGGREGDKLKLTNTNAVSNYPALFVKPMREKSYYTEKGYNSVTVSLYIDGDSLTESTRKNFIFFLNTSVPTVSVWIEQDTWTDVTLPLDSFYGAMDAEGYVSLFNVINKLEVESKSDPGIEIYIGAIRAGTAVYIPETESVYTQKVLYHMADSPVDGAANTLECTVQGGSQTEIQIFVKPIVTKETLAAAGYTHVRMRVYIDSATMTESSAATGSKPMLVLPDGAGNNCELFNVPLDRWFEMAFTLDEFFADQLTDGYLPLFTFYNFDWTENGEQVYYADPDFKIYLDTITAEKAD